MIQITLGKHLRYKPSPKPRASHRLTWILETIPQKEALPRITGEETKVQNLNGKKVCLECEMTS